MKLAPFSDYRKFDKIFHPSGKKKRERKREREKKCSSEVPVLPYLECHL